MKKKLFGELLRSTQEAAGIERRRMKPFRAFEVKSGNHPRSAQDDLAATRRLTNEFDDKEWQW